MKNLVVEASPHIKSGNTTQKIMLHVIIAMVPALIMSVYIFGLRALAMIAVCIASCIVFEYFCRKIMKRDQTVGDLSAVVTGILLAFNLPVTLPFYMAVIGCFIAIVVVKQMFGGIGQNFVNPAITARIALMLSFTAQMSVFVQPFYYRYEDGDTLAAATPLSIAGGDTAALSESTSVTDLLLGFHAGSLGETCAIALIIGFVYLLVTRVINPVTPLVFVGTVALGTFAGGGDVPIALLSGGLLICAIFMATDYATTPVTTPGKVIFALGCGLITLLIRSFASMPEGASFAILIMNILTPYIDKLTRSRPFGFKKEVGTNG